MDEIEVIQKLVGLVAELATKLALLEASKDGNVPDGRLVAARVQWLLSPLDEWLPECDLQIPELIEMVKRQIGNPWDPPQG